MTKVTTNFSEVSTSVILRRVILGSVQKFLGRVRPTQDCEKPNIELVFKTTLSNTENRVN